MSAESTEKNQKALRSVGLRVTPIRKRILEVLRADHGPFTAEEIHKSLGKKRCDLVTVYRSLDSLSAKGLVSACHFGDGTTRFELKHGTHHHHIICKLCGAINTVENCPLEINKEQFTKLGFRELSHSLEFFGICEQC